MPKILRSIGSWTSSVKLPSRRKLVVTTGSGSGSGVGVEGEEGEDGVEGLEGEEGELGEEVEGLVDG